MSSMDDADRRDEERSATAAAQADELERASENVLGDWPAGASEIPVDEPDPEEAPDAAGLTDAAPVETEPAAVEPEPATVVPDEPDEPDEPPADPTPARTSWEPAEASSEHAPAALVVPPGYPVLEGEPNGRRRAVGIVVSRFNGEITGPLLESALDELSARGVDQGSITVMPVPGAFELPLAAMALAKTRRFACIVALGCVIRGDTPHFDYVAGEAASGLQLAAIETGVPVAFGVLTLERLDQAEPRLAKGAEAVRTALEMADLFANLRTAAAR
jgi:6,7-dimethyl-8-ribityllumazine synthase